MRSVLHWTVGLYIVGGCAFTSHAKTIETTEDDSPAGVESSDRSFDALIDLPGVTFAGKIAGPLALGLSFDMGMPNRSSGRRTTTTTSRTITQTKSIGVMGRYRFGGDAFTTGLFASPYLYYVASTLRDSDTGFSISGRGYKICAIMGYGWFYGSGFNFQLGGGLRYQHMTFPDATFTKLDGTQGELRTGRTRSWGISPEVALGYAF